MKHFYPRRCISFEMDQRAVIEAFDEKALIGRARSGSAEAFGELVRAHQDRVFGLAWSVLRNGADTEDAAQEAFLRAFRNLDKLREGAPFGPWIGRIAVNLALNAAKSRRRRQIRLSLLESLMPSRTPVDPETPDFDAAMSALKPRQRLALELFHRDGLAYEEIAQLMETSVMQVKNHVHRGRKRLKKLLESEMRSANHGK